ncbi:probable protein phosphatase 2C 38 [Telopea speciosissima]|uniref:probable protein phosphatase 2C 38 n=1 Tax=Telopea speciosissima TaxID=54955 RepID=UPI001CC6AEDD|nr:probable protein phosphatase 2C 38 [Telopea speciosissima]
MDKELKLQENLDFSFSGTTAVAIVQQLQYVYAGETERIKKSNGRAFAMKDEPHVQSVWLPNDYHLSGLAMARAFGDFKLKDYGLIAVPDISYHHLTVNDQFLDLANDGVWDVLSNKQVASILWMADKEEEAAKTIVNAAVAAWAKRFPTSKVDDCTVLCCFLQERKQQHSLLLPKEDRPQATGAKMPIESANQKFHVYEKSAAK